MSISVKNSNANELAESMSEILSNEEFSSMFKKAEDLGAEFDPFATAKPTQTTGADFTGNVPVQQKTTAPLASGKKEVKPTVLPGLSTHTMQSGQNPLAKTPPAQHKADDQAAEDHEECHEEKHKDHEDKQECDAIERGSVAADDNVVAAVDFAITHLTKIAAALDNNGFAGLANIIDETIKRVAAKK